MASRALIPNIKPQSTTDQITLLNEDEDPVIKSENIITMRRRSIPRFYQDLFAYDVENNQLYQQNSGITQHQLLLCISFVFSLLLFCSYRMHQRLKRK